MEDPSKVPDIDYRPPQPLPDSGSTGKKVAIGCSIGCLVLLILAVIGVVLTYFWGMGQIEKIAEESPIVFEEPVADEATVQATVAKFESFRDAMANGKETGPLVLTGDEINLLICHHPNFEELKEHARVAVEEDRVTAKISLPLDQFQGLSESLKGRYMNGEATMRPVLNQGVLEIYLVDLVYGYNEDGSKKMVPDIFMTDVRTQDLMRDVRTKKELNAMFGALEEFKVEDGKIWFVPKSTAERP